MSFLTSNGSANSKEEMISAGICLIAELGIDQVTVADITKQSKFSRPTFYSYFGDVDGLFAEIWIRHGISWLEQLAGEAFESSSKKDEPLVLSLMEIVMASHRKIALLEVIEPMISAWWYSKVGGNPVKSVKLAWTISIRLGVLASKALYDEVSLAEKILPILSQIPSLEYRSLETYDSLEELTFELGSIFSNALDRNEHLKAAALEVIANAGVAGASMARIARRVHLTSGSVYPRFSSVSELVRETFVWGTKQIVDNNTEAYSLVNAGPSSYGALITATLSERRDIWRDFRQEVYLASRTSPDLASALEDAVRQSNEPLSMLMRSQGIAEALIPSFVSVLHALGVGLAALKTVGVPVLELNHSIPTRYLILQTAAAQKVSF